MFLVAGSLNGYAEETASAGADEAPMGSVAAPGGGVVEDASPVATELLGGPGGIIHPYFSLGTYYTDNFYNSKYYEKDEVSFLISPGVWIAYPGNHKQLLDVRTKPTSTGGLSYDRDFSENFRRFQSYLNYRADIEQNYHYSAENTTNHLAEGLMRLNLRGGLTFEVMDQFVKNHNIRSSSNIGKLDKYLANLATFNIIYHFNRKFRTQLEYRNYLVDYTAKRNDPMDRMDNVGSCYVFMQIMPKTSAFLQYEFTDIDFDKNIMPDSDQHGIYAGFDWRISSKSNGRFKLGYGHKNFDGKEYSDLDSFLLELIARHQLTGKTSLSARAFSGFNESMVTGPRAIRADEVSLDVDHKFTGKISMNINGSYHRDDFEGKMTYYGKTKSRDDDYYRAGIEFQYDMLKWLKFSLGYDFLKRDSSFSEFDYTNNTGYFNVLFYL